MPNQQITKLIGLSALILCLQSLTVYGQQTANLTPGSLKTDGLESEEILLKLFVGNFSEIGFQSDGMRNTIVFMSYVQAYSRNCGDYLPEGSKMLTKQVCAEWSITRNMMGHEISSTCMKYRTENTGTKIAPEMHQAMLQLEGDAINDLFRKTTEGMGDMDKSMGNLMDSFDMVAFQNEVRRDLNYLVQRHSCTSPVMMHFQENLRRYAIGQQPNRITYDESLFAGPPPPSDSENQNYERLVEDLVQEESRSWKMNKYVRGSISDVTVLSAGENGHPSRMEANYQFKGGFGGKEYRGSVTVAFDAGIPNCLYFFDFPDRCREPNERIVLAYSGGRYNQDGTGGSALQIKPYTVVEQMPELIGGMQQLQAKVKNLETVSSQGRRGRVIVQFIVDKQGKVVNPKVIRGIGREHDEEALRVVKLAKFKPGVQNGRTVPVQYSLPIIFRP